MGFMVEFSFNDITYVGHIHLPITYSCPLSPTSDSSSLSKLHPFYCHALCFV